MWGHFAAQGAGAEPGLKASELMLLICGHTMKGYNGKLDVKGRPVGGLAVLKPGFEELL